MSKIDDNNVKIADAGAVPLYVKMLSPEGDEGVLTEATRGLWNLAFKCGIRINDEPGCRDGFCFSVTFLLLYFSTYPSKTICAVLDL